MQGTVSKGWVTSGDRATPAQLHGYGGSVRSLWFDKPFFFLFFFYRNSSSEIWARSWPTLLWALQSLASLWGKSTQLSFSGSRKWASVDYPVFTGSLRHAGLGRSPPSYRSAANEVATLADKNEWRSKGRGDDEARPAAFLVLSVTSVKWEKVFNRDICICRLLLTFFSPRGKCPFCETFGCTLFSQWNYLVYSTTPYIKTNLNKWTFEWCKHRDRLKIKCNIYFCHMIRLKKVGPSQIKKRTTYTRKVLRYLPRDGPPKINSKICWK